MAALGGHFHMRRTRRVIGWRNRAGLLAALLLSACLQRPASPLPGTAQASNDDLAAAILRAHNQERAAAGVAPLSWDTGLAAAAAVHAKQLAAIGQLRHSPGAARPGQGENLWIGTRGAFTARQMVASWASEKSYFRAGIFPTVSRTGDWSAVGHYTQMIWPSTTRLGCAIGSSPRFDVLVCRYAPAGNIDGRRVP